MDDSGQAVARRKQHVEEIHEWRRRRSRVGELVQWHTSGHDCLEGRGAEILPINMIDDATSRWFARFVTTALPDPFGPLHAPNARCQFGDSGVRYRRPHRQGRPGVR